MAVSLLKRCLFSGVSSLALASAYAPVANALPQGGSVTAGEAAISQTGTTTTIGQSTERAIIQWNSFDVGASEHVDFVQPSRSSITVNRIHDSKPSQVDGRVTANGNILLLNQNGVVFGSGSQIDVGGLVASSSDIEDDAAFMAGGAVKLTRPGKADASIIQRGTLTVADAGLVGLVAPNVENHGTINARLGKAVLASGDTATLDFAGDGLIQIAISDATTKQLIKNTGTIRADDGIIQLTAGQARQQVDSLIDNTGSIISRRSSHNSSKIIINNQVGSIQSTGLIDASSTSGSNGGDIAISGSFVSLGGSVLADGHDGGTIRLDASTLSLADTISARGLINAGGAVNIYSQTSWETSTSVIDVSGNGLGGSIRHVADQQIISSGTARANSAHGMGGSIDISAWTTKFLSALAEAKGFLKGGTIRLGGEYQGGKHTPVDELPNANYLIMDRGTRLRADATGDHGDGGTVILWSDGETVAMGDILARLGLLSGAGGFVEVSSGDTLKFDATIDAGRGSRSGTVLLDPKNILISDFSFNSTAIILGYGYQGGRTNQNTNLDSNDQLGIATSLNGNRMVVGAFGDDGFNNTATNTGAAYLFSFTDSSFSGGVLEGIIGRGYTGGKNIDLALDNSDQFGVSVSLDGNRLAVGAYTDDGAANGFSDSGSVYLFSFTDSAFTGGILESTIGRGHTGGKNFNVATLGNSDLFGSAVSLDGNRLAVGAYADDGFGNTVTNSGAVYLFSFADSAFNGATLEATIGNGYTGGKNVNIALDASDYFGYSLSLDGNALAIGAYLDDGFGNTRTDAGAAYLFSFADSAFSGGALESIIGYGYTGGKNINFTPIDAGDQFAYSISLDANRLAIGSTSEDGYLGASGNNYGAVHLFSATDAVFSNITLQSTIGFQYRETSKDFDLSGLGIGGSDFLGSSLSLDGNRLVVGANGDDGITNATSAAGAVYSFTFADASFTSPTLQGIIGSGYVQGKNVNVPTLNDSDNNLGTSVSVNGNRLVVGNYLDDGLNNRRPGSGAVYLYSFADNSYSGGTLEAIIGDGYTGGKNYNQALRVSDGFGVSVSLDGNRLAVGSYQDDGLLANCGNCGAAYLYSFTDSVFSGAALESRVGFGFTGAKDINVALGSNDQFGYSIALNGNRLAVGASTDDGLANVLTNSGAVYLFTFADSVFSGGVQQAILGRGYTGGKNIDIASLDASDFLGFSVALNGNQLAVGARDDDGFGNLRSNSGTVYLFNFSDSSFTGGALTSQIGDGYTGGKNINITLGANDYFGSAVGLANNNLFVGAYGDDGSANAITDAGAVYRFSFSDAVFSSGTLAATIGSRYIGTNDYDLRGQLHTSDSMGRSLSVDGQNLVIGAFGDDAYANNATDSGAVYLFRYTDTTYATPILQGIAGGGYGISVLNKSVVTTNVKENDQFGNAVSIDGNRIAIGAPRDDGFNDVGTDRGAVYLYSFSDSSFTGGVLESIIGQGYTGGKNINLALANSDYFGSAVSLDGNRIAIGAYADDGFSNTNTDAGAVYLYSFSDSAFSGGTLQGIIGRGYNGGKNVNRPFDNSDYFGWSVALDGNRLAVGAQRDDGSGNTLNDSGAVYLFSFSDSVFSGGTLEATLGQGYTGGKNLNVTLGSSDYYGSAVSLDGTMLAVGAPLDDGNANALTDAGAVYFYSFTDSVFSGGVQQGIAGSGYTGGKNINVSTLETTDRFGASVSLSSNRLAVGVEQDDGFNNQASDSGLVALYSFTDALFSGGTLQSLIGYKYTGGKNFDLAANFISEMGDRFAFAGLDGNRLIIGGYFDDGSHLTNAGALAMLTFSDSAFNGASLVGVTGNGYVGGKNISFTPSFYQAPDNYGSSVSLGSNRLAVGVIGDDGFGDGLVNSGAVYLYSIPSGDYDAIALESIIGHGYTGGKNIDMSAYLDRSDNFGTAVSVDGNRLAVGAYLDDGLSNNITSSGAVYLFSFADNLFTGGVLESIIGSGYTGGKNINTVLGGSDYFGYSLSLDGNRLAVGAQRDDGLTDANADAGAVYLYTFTDNVFSGGSLQSRIGRGYTGGKNYNLALDNSDSFGSSVSLDGNRLAIGAINDDGVANAGSNLGAAYLFSFSDTAFTAPVLQATIGSGYAGGKNYDMSALATGDAFGSAIALDGTVLAVGASGDQGFGIDTGGRQGAIFIYSFADSVFSNPIYDSTIGSGYTGGKNIAQTLGGGFGNAVSLDSGVLVASAPSLTDVTGQLGSTGRVYIYRDSLSPISFGSSFAIEGGSTVGITAASIAGLLSAGTNVILQASNDITLGSTLLVNNGLGNGGTLTLQAGRSILLNAALDTDNGDLNIFANENLSTGVINSQRDVGAAVISMGVNGSVNAGTGDVVFRIDSGTGKTNFTAGDMTLRTINAGSFKALSGAQTGNITIAGVISASEAGDAIVIDAGANFHNTYGVGALSTPAGRWLLYGDHSTYSTPNGLLSDFTSYDCVYGGSCIITIPPTGNGTLYEYAVHLLTVTLNTSRVYGAANPSLAAMQALYQYTGFQGADTAAVLDSLPTATIASGATASANAGTTHAITFSGGSDNFYDYYFIDGLLTITKRDISAAWNSTLSKNYGDTNPSVNTTNFTYTGLVNGENNSVITANASFGAVDTTTGAGAYNVGASFTATNYNITNSPTTTLTINKRNITSAWTGGLSRIYGDTNPTVDSTNFTFTGLVNGDLGSVITPTADYGAITSSSDVGTYTNGVGASFLATNYNITNTPTTNLSITKRDITASVNAASRAYGDANPNWDWSQVTWGNLANSETGSTIDALTLTAPTAIATSATGTTHVISLTGFNDNNYNLTTSTAGTLTIDKRNITAAWTGGLSRIYGDTNPAVNSANFTFSGLVNGDLGSVITPTVDYGTITSSSDVGTYTNGVGASFLATNYNITNTPTTNLSITKRDITASVNNANRAYGDANPNWDWNQVTWGNLANSETGAVLDTLTISAPSAISTSNAGTTHAITLTGFSDNNYNLTTNNAGSLTIDQSPVTLQVTDLRRTAQAPNPPLTYSLLGLKNGESNSVFSGISLSTTATQSSLAGRYSITAMGGVALNYIITSYLDGELLVTNANNLPNTYEAVQSDIYNISSLDTRIPQLDGTSGENAISDVVIVPDDYDATDKNPVNALIAITTTLKSLFSI